MRGLQYVFLVSLIRASECLKPRIDDGSFQGSRMIPKIEDREVVRPVPFGHIYKEGFGDIEGQKAPLDFLDLNMRHPMESEEARELLKNTKPEKIQFYENFARARGYTNPRDKILKELGVADLGPQINETQFRWYDLADLQLRNVARRPLGAPRRHNPGNSRVYKEGAKSNDAHRFTSKNFVPLTENEYVSEVNFTRCEEFRSKTNFYPGDIVDLTWVPFYIWSPSKHTTTKVHKFTYATKKLVQSVRELYRKFIAIDWEQPKLVYQGVGNFLLVAIDKRGLFHALQLIDSPPAEVIQSVPYTKLQLKIADPYLVILYCTDSFAAVMAVSGKEPPTDKEKQDEADTIGLIGPGWPVTRDLVNEEIQSLSLRQAEIRKKEEEERYVGVKEIVRE